MVNDDLREFEEETSSQEETEEEETSSQEETEEEETSSQEETEEEETSSQEETEEEETSNSYDPEQSSYETVLLTSPDSIDSYDYSSYFENLQSLGIILTAFVLGVGLALAFALGFKRD